MGKGPYMYFCRRCGTKLTHQQGHVFVCAKGHTIFANASPAVGLILYNDQGEALVIRRAIDPGKGRFDAPGGFCDGDETAEAAVAREVREEISLASEDYETPQFVLSGIDRYAYQGEVGSALGLMFRAKLVKGAQPKAADDAAAVEFVPFQSLDMEQIYFPSVRAAYQSVRQDLSKSPSSFPA